MSLVCEELHDLLARHRHSPSAIAKFAQVLADCESTNWTVAQQAHEDVHEMQVSMEEVSYDILLTEATEFMVRKRLRPNTWLDG